MALYCGIDLHSSNCQIVVLDQKLDTVAERRHRNEFGEIVKFRLSFNWSGWILA